MVILKLARYKNLTKPMSAYSEAVLAVLGSRGMQLNWKQIYVLTGIKLLPGSFVQNAKLGPRLNI